MIYDQKSTSLNAHPARGRVTTNWHRAMVCQSRNRSAPFLYHVLQQLTENAYNYFDTLISIASQRVRISCVEEGLSGKGVADRVFL